MHCSIDLSKVHSPLFSAALQNGVTAGLRHCNYTLRDLLFIHLCSEPTEMHCSTAKGKMHSPLFSAALQNRLTAGLCQCNHICGNLLFMQVCSDKTEMHCNIGQAKCIPHCSVLLCKTGSQHACVTAVTHMDICSSYRCAVTQQKCTTALLRAKGNPHCSVLLCKTGSQQARVTAIISVSLQLQIWRFALHTGVQ